MEDFIKNIFDIDEEAKEYKVSLENKKLQLMEDRKSQIKEMDDKYHHILDEEKSKLAEVTKELEEQEIKKLDDFKKKSEDIKSIFASKKTELIDKYAKHILESGGFYEQ